MKWLKWLTQHRHKTSAPEPKQKPDSGLDEPEQRLHDASDLDRVLDFLHASQQILIVNSLSSTEVFHFILTEVRQDSLLLHLLNRDSIWQVQTQLHDLSFNAMAPVGSVMWRVPVWEKQQAYIVTPRPQVMIRLQSRRHYRIVGLGQRHHKAQLVLTVNQGGQEAQLTLDIDNLSEEGVSWSVEATPFASVYEHGQVINNCLLQLGKDSIKVAAIRIVRMGVTTGAAKLKLGAQLHGMSEQDRRLLRRWLSEAELKKAAS